MGESIIYTSYFCSMRDPQRKECWLPNKISPEFRQNYTTDKIQFIKYFPYYNILTDRFHCYRDHMKTHFYKKVLCLDCHDVEIFKDPFPLIGSTILVGSEEGKIGNSEFIKDWFRRAYGETFYPDNKILNCGILGGERIVLYELLSRFYRETKGKAGNIDMAVFNKLIYDDFEHKTGHPVHTLFNKNEGRDSGCYIRHK